MPIYLATLANERSDHMQMDFLIQARQDAGYQSREVAELAVPFAFSTIGRHERGDIPLHPEDVLQYAQGYNAPDLPFVYCRSACPIGCQLYASLQERDLSNLAISVSIGVKRVFRGLDRLQEIAEDDRVDAAERQEFDAIIAQIRALRNGVDELELFARRIQNKKTRQPAANRTAVCGKGNPQHKYLTGAIACQRG